MTSSPAATLRSVAPRRPTAAPGSPGARVFGPAAVAAAVVVFALLQVVAVTELPPVRTMVSDLVYAPAGSVLFPLGAAMVACAAAVWARRLARVHRAAAAFATAASAAAVVLGLVPTDPASTVELSLSGQIHRYAALAMFISIPAAALLSVRSLPAVGRRWSRVAVALCLVLAVPALLGTFVAVLPAPWRFVGDACYDVRGLVERVQLLAMLTAVALGTGPRGGVAARGRGPASTATVGPGPLSRGVAGATMGM